MHTVAQPRLHEMPPAEMEASSVPRAVAAPRQAGPGRLAGWLRGTVGGKDDWNNRLRLLVQGGLTLVCVLLGVQLARFPRAAAAGDLPLPARPPGVEGFLPSSGKMGLLDWICQGTLNRVRPSGELGPEWSTGGEIPHGAVG